MNIQFQPNMLYEMDNLVVLLGEIKVSKEQILISKIDLLLEQFTEYQQLELTTDNRLYCAAGQEYALQEWKTEIKSSGFNFVRDNFPRIASRIERNLWIIRKGVSNQPEAVKGRRMVSETINTLIKPID